MKKPDEDAQDRRDGEGPEDQKNGQAEKGGALAPGYSDELNNWLEKIGLREHPYKYINYLYRATGDEKNLIYLKTYRNEFPELDTIGIEHGGGKYKLNSQVFVRGKSGKIEKEGNWSTFYIDESFTEKKRIADEEKAAKEQKLTGRTNLSGGMLDAANVVGLVQSLMTTALQTRPPQNNDAASILRLANTLAEDQIKQNFKLINQTRRQLLESRMEDADFEETPGAVTTVPQNPLVDTITGLVEQYAPMILGGGPAADGIVKTVKNLITTMPGLQAVTTDAASMRKIINAVNRKHGPEETRRLFGMIGFKI